MINKRDITEAAKKMLRKHHGLRDPQIIHPRRDWLLGVGLALVIFTGVTWWSVASYLNYSHISVVDSIEAADTSVVYRAAQVQAALELYESRTQNYYGLLQNRVVQTPPVPQEIDEEESVATSTDTTATQELVATSTDIETEEGI